jgi:hypothetical protein
MGKKCQSVDQPNPAMWSDGWGHPICWVVSQGWRHHTKLSYHLIHLVKWEPVTQVTGQAENCPPLLKNRGEKIQLTFQIAEKEDHFDWLSDWERMIKVGRCQQESSPHSCTVKVLLSICLTMHIAVLCNDCIWLCLVVKTSLHNALNACIVAK